MTRPDWRATYRLQFHAGFTFDDALAILPYLERLGISHLYASPLFASRPGSTHGYDVVDPTRINPELGGEEGFHRLSDGLRAAGMGLLLDIVPNHMAADRANPWWMGALAGGREGPAAAIFDIDWERHPQVLLPVLGDTLVETLAQGSIALELDGEGWLVASAYGEQAWPLRREDAAQLLAAAGLADQGRLWLSDRTPDLAGARAALRSLTPSQATVLNAVLKAEDLPALLERQHWRPVHWRSGRDALSSRRFFNVNELVGVRVEREEVFLLTHRLALDLVREGRVDGLRIDHIDGLADPARYAQRLREAVGPEVPILIEKILGHGEEIRPEWPVDGTTGYERLNVLNRTFVSAEGYRRLAEHLDGQGWVTGEPAARLHAAKRQMLEESFAPELEQIADLAQSLATPDAAIEFALPTLRVALSSLLVNCPVYRSYLTGSGPDAADLALWEGMLAAVEVEGDPWTGAAARWLAEIILSGEGPVAAELRRRFQQLSGPLMAKGLEDTEFYRAVALTSVNEVGGELEEAGGDIAGFHAWAATRAAREPRDLTPLATHDTKRGPEVRARLNLLSLEPEAWIAAATRWMEMNAPLRPADGPDPADEWLIYQTMLGAWPIDAERLREYLTKAMREAKRHTRWENPQEAYEKACLDFATALLEAPEARAFRDELTAYVDRLAVPGRINGLSQTILQLTLPGVPDLYQGTEWWDFSLVDPDNRRPVDYAARAKALGGDVPPLAGDTLGIAKQQATHRLLTLRRARPELFEGYEALEIGEGVLGFTRGGGRLAVIVPTRALRDLTPPSPPPGTWTDLLPEISIPRVLVRS
ncbi:malto-oligosyltrehalose synthase [Roseococcus pinisoli]|uniref:Malto-oligosyltrehalose synthase n=1 Tax=Roseococcus pinisoli TaxID=2835040 RepID=A0ABS5QI75_9PROT|nr:malto-oligosyltrehalose synthase [Roseococcus pinisoli]MBS7813372.1 malto-oligosyltrehalose synthase [Roseococcus pinisoli]